MATNKQIIDFARLGGPVYIGRPKGEAARKKLNVASFDGDANVVVEVGIPSIPTQ
jgi:hypothetical protein